MRNKFFLLAVFLLSVQISLAFDLAPLFTDHMVLQRDHIIPVWGRASPGSVVSVTLDGNEIKVTASATGNWKAEFPMRPASKKPISLIVTGDGKTITIADILVGDVWFCSGQSNMGVNVSGAKGATEELKHADYPSIRLYTIPPATGWRPGEYFDWNFTGNSPAWKVCNAQTAAGFTAVGYVFGSELYKKLDVPIGLINAAFGGAPIEPFIPVEFFKQTGRYAYARGELQKAEKISDEQQVALEAKFKKWFTDRIKASESTTSIQAGWQQPAFDDTKWKTMQLPGFWQENAALKIDGTVWFRRSLKLRANDTGADRLSIGYVRMGIRVWANGKELVSAPEAAGLSSMTYAIPPGTLKEGENVIALRIYSMYTQGGLKKINESDFSLQRRGKPATVVADLSGDWRYEPEVPIAQEPHPMRQSRSFFTVPGVIWNAMIYPETSFPVTGVVWYQGESNVTRAGEYYSLLQLMIESWRKAWNNPGLPFLLVQLPNYNPRVSEPGESNWASLRAAQDSVLRLPHTGIAVTYDVGEEKELHPRDKRSVGERLSLVAQEMVYKTLKPAQAFSPRAVSAKGAGNKISVQFSPSIKLKTSDGKAPGSVAVCGADGKFIWAKAAIKGKKLIVRSDLIKKITRIRYAWADNPDANLEGENNLPVAPFEIKVND